jgi:hypothetical protein
MTWDVAQSYHEIDLRPPTLPQSALMPVFWWRKYRSRALCGPRSSPCQFPGLIRRCSRCRRSTNRSPMRSPRSSHGLSTRAAGRSRRWEIPASGFPSVLVMFVYFSGGLSVATMTWLVCATDHRCGEHPKRRVGHAQVPDEIAHFPGYTRTSVVDSTLASPIKPKSRTVLGDDGLGFHDQQGRAPARPQTRDPNPENTVGRLQAKSTVTL